MSKRNLISIDLAKATFQVEVEDLRRHKILSSKTTTRRGLKRFLARQEAGIVAMEACGTAHYWCWYAKDQGHETILLPPQHVKPYRQGHKTDATDTRAIREAAKRPDRKEAVQKTPELVELQTLLRVRDHYVDHKRQLSNMIRMHLLEFGICIPKSYAALQREIRPILEDAENGLMALTRELIDRLYQSFVEAAKALKELDNQLKAVAKASEPCQRLMKLEGVGPVCAMLLYVRIGDGSAFKDGREAAALVGVTPQQYSSGGNVNLGHIRKKGVDKQSRALLLQGAKSVIHAKREPRTKKDFWLRDLIRRRGENVAAVALVNKTVRTAWAMLSRGEEYVA